MIRVRVRSWRVVIHNLFLALMALPFLLPAAWLLLTALKPTAQVYASPHNWLPSPPTLENFRLGWNLLDFPTYYKNTAIVVLFTVIGNVASSSIAGFAFALLPARGREMLFLAMLVTIMIPPAVTLIPLFVLFAGLGWTNSFLPLIVPPFFANAFYVFLFRQYFRSLPKELFDSAEIDGCNPLQAYIKIALPLSRPIVATVAIFSFVAAWNDFMAPLVYLSTPDRFTLSLGLAMFQGTYGSQLHYLIPMTLLSIVPVVLLFGLTQGLLIEGISQTHGAV